MISIAPVSYIVKAALMNIGKGYTAAHHVSSPILYFLGGFEDKSIAPLL